MKFTDNIDEVSSDVLFCAGKVVCKGDNLVPLTEEIIAHRVYNDLKAFNGCFYLNSVIWPIWWRGYILDL